MYIFLNLLFASVAFMPYQSYCDYEFLTCEKP